MGLISSARGAYLLTRTLKDADDITPGEGTSTFARRLWRPQVFYGSRPLVSPDLMSSSRAGPGQPRRRRPHAQTPQKPASSRRTEPWPPGGLAVQVEAGSAAGRTCPAVATSTALLRMCPSSQTGAVGGAHRDGLAERPLCPRANDYGRRLRPRGLTASVVDAELQTKSAFMWMTADGEPQQHGLVHEAFYVGTAQDASRRLCRSLTQRHRPTAGPWDRHAAGNGSFESGVHKSRCSDVDTW